MYYQRRRQRFPKVPKIGDWRSCHRAHCHQTRPGDAAVPRSKRLPAELASMMTPSVRLPVVVTLRKLTARGASEELRIIPIEPSAMTMLFSVATPAPEIMTDGAWHLVVLLLGDCRIFLALKTHYAKCPQERDRFSDGTRLCPETARVDRVSVSTSLAVSLLRTRTVLTSLAVKARR
jgi:hypothetical protein